MRKLAIFLIFANLVHLWLVLPIGNLLEQNEMIGHIVALGGGGFFDGARQSAAGRFHSVVVSAETVVCLFIPTASAESATYITKFYRAFSGRCIPTDLHPV